MRDFFSTIRKLAREPKIIVLAFFLVFIILVWKFRSDFFSYRRDSGKGEGKLFITDIKDYCHQFQYIDYVADTTNEYSGENVYNEDGKIIGMVDKKGDVRNRNGRVIGKIDGDGKVWDKDEEYLGATEKPSAFPDGTLGNIEPAIQNDDISKPHEYNGKPLYDRHGKIIRDVGKDASAHDKNNRLAETNDDVNDSKDDKVTSIDKPVPSTIPLKGKIVIPPQSTADHIETVDKSDKTATLTDTDKVTESIVHKISPVIDSSYSSNLSVLKKIDEDRILPIGQLILCKLYNTIDSSRIDTPAIAMVIRDVEFNHRVFIRAGTEIHGFMQNSNMRDRIGSKKQWTIVFKNPNDPVENGKELKFKGIALNMKFNTRTKKWSIEDGLAGIQGKLHNENSYADLKMFLAAVLEGAGEGLTRMQISNVGDQTIQSYGGDWQSVAGQAASAGFELLVDRIKAQLMRDAVYVRVAAGKCFYLYNLQAIDFTKARKGASL